MEEIKDERSNFMIMLNNLWVLFLVLVPTAIIYSVIMSAVFAVNNILAIIMLATIGVAIAAEVVKYVKNRKKEDV